MQAVIHSGALTPTIFLNPIRAGLPICGGTLEVLVRVQAPTASAYPAADRRRHCKNHQSALCTAIGNIMPKAVRQNSLSKK